TPAPSDARPTPADRRRARRRRRHNRHLIDPLTRRQRRNLLAITVAWAASTVWAWAWWVQPGHVESPLAMGINSALLATETVFLPVWFFFWIWRMKRPDTGIAVPVLRVAIVVTKAPSEPWPLVRETLEAMLTQEFPYPYDAWLADEQPDEPTRRWCAEHGVRLSTRYGVADYHRPTWPRRTRCKEGNLAYFYDHFGYDAYDVVVQLDADHVPAPAYLRHMVMPFADPDVGYVAAPSVCDRNADRSWSARGRLYAEAVLHGPTQAGHSGGYAPSCIGSHYAVRTQALREVGGLGPELAEDFTTTLMLSSQDWQGVFAIDAEAHGDGPETLADCLTQEFQWSRSMMNVLLGVNHRYWKGLRRSAKVRLGFCQLWYPLFGLLMLASVLGPIVAIAMRAPFVRVSLTDFYGHFTPAMLTLLLVVLWLRRLEFLRPRTAHAVSWEMALFQLVRWPWALIGCVHAIVGRIMGREFSFKVTPKGREGAVPLPMRILAPYLLLATISASPFLLQLDGGEAAGYRKLALLNVVLYLLAALAIVALHVHEHPRPLRAQVLRQSAGKLSATIAVASIIGMMVFQPVPTLSPERVEARPVAAWPVRAPIPGQVVVGVTTAALAKNSTARWTRGDLNEVNAFEQDIRGHAGIVQWFADWAHNPHVDLAQLRATAARGSVPQISWEPWDYTRGLNHRQPAFRLATITSGSHDAYIRTWARELAAYGGPVALRFAHEMNGSWYPWAQAGNGNRRGDYRRAWRHVHAIFVREGASNVRWIWAPVAKTLDGLDYPGDDVVDEVGLSGFNGGSALRWTGWRTFMSIFAGPLNQLHRIAPHKPVQISEVGSAEAGGDKGRWILDMFAYLRKHPGIRSLLWFDLRKQTDWRIASSRRSAEAFASGLGWPATGDGAQAPALAGLAPGADVTDALSAPALSGVPPRQ
ncbi:MAG: glycosyl transferase 2 family protein, partial [Solirubrobacterales bacterium]|nr:glycosyl transferase 2 family protein [Solirubrobacterales bacterium]